VSGRGAGGRDCHRPARGPLRGGGGREEVEPKSVSTQTIKY
jgi:hypothetical protein